MQEAIVLLVGEEFNNPTTSEDVNPKRRAAKQVVEQLITLARYLRKRSQPVHEFILLAPYPTKMNERTVQNIIENYEKNRQCRSLGILSKTPITSRYTSVACEYFNKNTQGPTLPRLFIIGCPEEFSVKGKGKQLNDDSSSNSQYSDTTTNVAKSSYDKFMLDADTTMRMSSRIFIILVDMVNGATDKSAPVINSLFNNCEGFSNVIRDGLLYSASNYQHLMRICNQKKYHDTLCNMYHNISEKFDYAIATTSQYHDPVTPDLKVASGSVVQKPGVDFSTVVTPVCVEMTQDHSKKIFDKNVLLNNLNAFFSVTNQEENSFIANVFATILYTLGERLALLVEEQKSIFSANKKRKEIKVQTLHNLISEVSDLPRNMHGFIQMREKISNHLNMQGELHKGRTVSRTTIALQNCHATLQKSEKSLTLVSHMKTFISLTTAEKLLFSATDDSVTSQTGPQNYH